LIFSRLCFSSRSAIALSPWDALRHGRAFHYSHLFTDARYGQSVCP
jgi:hypothetical protein